jgi:integrase/recombinase XerD
MSPLDQQFQQFLRERTYLQNITPKTREWYSHAWRAFTRWQAAHPRDSSITHITQRDLQGFVIHLRERGVKPVSCNSWLRAMNSFCRWLHEQGATPTLVHLPLQRLEKRLLKTFDELSLRLILAFRPKTLPEWRVHTVACTILDTGCRIDELLSARVECFDFDNLLLTVIGKGRKERRVPFSLELRRMLYRFSQRKERAEIASDLMFPSRNGDRWHPRNARRSYYCLLNALGLPKTGFHHLRHTFATQYLRNGGDVVRLSIILGHTEVSTTMRYLHLVTADIQAPHQRLSILNRLR